MALDFSPNQKYTRQLFLDMEQQAEPILTKEKYMAPDLSLEAFYHLHKERRSWDEGEGVEFKAAAVKGLAIWG